MLQKNKWAFSIVLAMILVIIMLLVAYNLLDMLIPFSKNTKWIENASNAYYQSYWRVEQSINFIAKNQVWASSWITMSSNAIWYSIFMDSSGKTIPAAWKWNSEFNSDWNRIWPGEPVQLYINWTQTFKKFRFRVPDLNRNWTFDWASETLSWNSSFPIINWQISGSWLTLNASWSQIMADKIWNIWWTTNIDISSSNWLDLSWSRYTLTNFYSNTALLNKCFSAPCSLKLSIVNQLLTNNWTQIPYLEYQIDFDSSVPQQYVDITTEWKSYWFKKTINTKYRVDTTSEAFDFTVFQ
jgi:hypothetical protein